MAFSSRQISPDKWGIYSDTGLIATVSCQKTCETILANLASGRRDAPNTELNSLYKVPKLKRKGKPLSIEPIKPPLKKPAKKRARRSATRRSKTAAYEATAETTAESA